MGIFPLDLGFGFGLYLGDFSLEVVLVFILETSLISWYWKDPPLGFFFVDWRSFLEVLFLDLSILP